MTQWTSLLEALHSAWIDEMTERYPDPKPELAMPARMPGFGAPPASAAQLAVAHVRFTDDHGSVLMVPEEGAEYPLLEIGARVLERGKLEFAWHEIHPAVGAFELKAADAFDLKGARVTVWMPMAAKNGRLWFGVTAGGPA